MAVHDRRLIIGNTNLGQLERGLSTAIANLVHQISSNALATIRQSRADAQTAQDAQLARAQDTTRAAETHPLHPRRVQHARQRRDGHGRRAEAGNR